MQSNHYPSVLTIAGSDSSGGAGIQADIKAISATGSYAASVITALTAQNTLGVQAVQEIPPDFVMQQLDSVFSDLNIRAVKIGMLHNEQVISVVAAALEKFKPPIIILDPVMISKNGCELLKPTVIDFLKDKLFSLATLITPNLIEAEKLLGIKIISPEQQEHAAINLGERFKINVLIKGGHFEGSQSSDIVYLRDSASCHWFHTPRINSKNTHGTGCTLSAAIASYCAQGYGLCDSIQRAKIYLTRAIECGKNLKIGQGCGPVKHI